jgi:hypothetical protein
VKHKAKYKTQREQKCETETQKRKQEIEKRYEPVNCPTSSCNHKSRTVAGFIEFNPICTFIVKEKLNRKCEREEKER